MADILIDSSIPIYANYFHAISKDGTTDIFRTDAASVNITVRPRFISYDIVDKIIKPLTTANTLRADGTALLVPLEGYLRMPDTAGTRFPLLIIAHGNFIGYFDIKDTEPTAATEGVPELPGERAFSIRADQVPSYIGYHKLQDHLAERGIASYSINLNIVNSLENNERIPFKHLALDVNQRILLFFLHLKLLKMLAGEPLSITGTDEFPIKFFQDSTLVNLNTALLNSANTKLLALRDMLAGKIDFTRIGLMGHSRGADAVSRIPAYFFKGGTLSDPKFPFNPIVNDRIQTLSTQVGSPPQGFIKSILALEPGAEVNDDDAANHGYEIEDPETLFFLAAGTHDEDVSFDVVRMYEYPKCSKSMVAINNASHKRFNKIWAGSLEAKKFPGEKIPGELLSLKCHAEILIEVFGRCFTSTLGSNPVDLKYFSKQLPFPVPLARAIDLQHAWKFGFPIQTNTATLNDLQSGVTGISQSNLDHPFEQDVDAFLVEKTNEGNFVIKITVDPTGSSNLSNYTHFSFRFAKGFDVSSNQDRIEEKNFTIQFFENDSRLGNLIQGSDIKTIELKALQSLPQRKTKTDPIAFVYSILLQTAEIVLTDWVTENELKRVNRIDITVIPDKSKAAPLSLTKRIFGSLGGAVVVGLVGLAGSAIYNSEFDEDEEGETEEEKAEEDLTRLIGSSVGGFVVGAVGTFWYLLPDKAGFAFKDFLLTKRIIP